MHRAAPLPQPLGRTPFAVKTALGLGVAPDRLRRGDLHVPFRGVRTAAVPRGVRELAFAYAQRMSPDQYFSHTTAAQLLGMRLPPGFAESTLHVTSIAPTRAPRVLGVTGHQAKVSVATIDTGGMRVSSGVETWVQLASSLTVDDLIVMGDGLVCRRSPLSSMSSLEEAASTKGLTGATKLRKALTEIRPRTDSAPETVLRLLLVRSGFPQPAVNEPVFNAFGALIAHGDLVYPQFRTIIEYDGRRHMDDERQFSIDIQRLDDLMEEDWRVIRVDKHLMRKRATLFSKVDTALRSGGWTGRVR